MLSSHEDRVAVIVGYGHAGRDLHHRVLRSLYGDAVEVWIVDPVGAASLDGGRWTATLAGAFAQLDAAGATGRAVFHVTAPPGAHLTCLEEIAARGGSRAIVEKPLVASTDEAARLVELADSVSIVPVGVWLSSRVTELVVASLAGGAVGDLQSIRIEQNKPRFGRSLSCCSHVSALEVELPHQLLLALHIGGPDAKVVHARTWDLHTPSGTFPLLGGAEVVLEHAGGVVTTLYTDLGSPVRTRRVTVTGSRGQVIGDFPLATGDDYGQVRLGSGPGIVVHDAPLTRLIREAYAYFEGSGEHPAGEVGLHLNAIKLMADIAAIAHRPIRLLPAAMASAVMA
jgi:predicted dehydrogenase